MFLEIAIGYGFDLVGLKYISLPEIQKYSYGYLPLLNGRNTEDKRRMTGRCMEEGEMSRLG
jgi:hypothetical protein